MSSRSSRHKEKHALKSVVYQESRDEGTSARTRPFSFDEIMLKRKNKKSGDVEDVIGDAKDTSVKEIEKVSDHSVSGRGRRNSNDVLPVVKHASEDFLNVSSRKREDITATTGDRLVSKREKDNHDGNRLVNKSEKDSRDSKTKKQTSEDILRISPRRKEDNTAVTRERLVSDRYKDNRERDNRDSGIKSRATTRNIEVSDKAKGRKDDRWDHGRRKNDERAISYSENQSENRHPRYLLRKDRYEERSRGNPEKESKNKHRVEDDERIKERSAAEKNSSRKWDDSETSKRKLSHIHQEESRQKRRRSRSREHDKDRGRRSVSVSPRAQKHKSYNTSEQGDLPSHSSKDKSRRQQSDDDRHRVSDNGVNNHYRRHGESTSQLGGYSPRKRKTEAAVKTPSPPHWSHPEKKSATWDLPPAGADGNLIVPVITNVDTSNQTVASNRNQISVVDPASSKAVKVLSGVLSNATIDSIQLTQATRPMRRIYVENLPASVSEKDVMEYLNNFLVSSGVAHVQGSEPCISCSIHKEKGQALVEFLTPEYASAALSLDGRSFSSSILKIRRPKDFVEVATGGPDKSVAAVDAVGDIVRDSSHKIFIGGISMAVSPEMLKEIVSAFGILKAYHLEANVDHNGPCAFLEYVDQSVTLKACASLNGMRLGGQLLTVVLATPDAPSSVENIGNSPFYGIPEHAKPLLEKPTQVLKLKNLLDPDSLSSLSEAELEEILDDTRLECARFGTIKSVNVVKCSDFKTIPENQKVHENRSSSNDREDLNCKEKDMTAETSGENIDFGSEEVSRSEPQNNGKEAEEVDKAVEGRGICVEKLQDDILEDELRNPCQIDGKVDLELKDNDKEAEEVDKFVEGGGICVEKPQDEVMEDGPCNPSQIDGKVDLESNDEMECCDNKVDYTIQATHAKVDDVENESADGDKLQSVEANGHLQESLAEMDLGETANMDDAKKGENGVCFFGLEDVFEPGCVLVEYKRTEAASMAAHCLHGRGFDNRIVAVGYVDYEIYKARFPK